MIDVDFLADWDNSVLDLVGNPLGGVGGGNGDFAAGTEFSNVPVRSASSNWGLVILGLAAALGTALALRSRQRGETTPWI